MHQPVSLSIALTVIALAPACHRKELDSLGVEERIALEILRRATAFEGDAVGFSTLPSDGNLAWRVLFRHAAADAAFRKVFEDATPAGKLYALCGVYHTDRAFLRAASAELIAESGARSVPTLFGCIGGEQTVAELVGFVLDGTMPLSFLESAAAEDAGCECDPTEALDARLVARRLAQLRDPDPTVRREALQAVSPGTGARSLLPALIELLHDPQASLRTAAAGVLGAMGPWGAEAFGPLRDRALELAAELEAGEETPTERDEVEAVLVALVALDRDEGALLLAELLRHASRAMRDRAARALTGYEPATLSIARAAPAIAQGLRDHRRGVRIRAACVLGTMRPGNAAARAALEGVANDPDAGLAAVAREALREGDTLWVDCGEELAGESQQQEENASHPLPLPGWDYELAPADAGAEPELPVNELSPDQPDPSHH